VSVVCCQVEVSATGWSLVQRSPTECGVSECDREASIMRRPRPLRGCYAIEKKKYNANIRIFKMFKIKIYIDRYKITILSIFKLYNSYQLPARVHVCLDNYCTFVPKHVEVFKTLYELYLIMCIHSGLY
jgi:hypothetical protein